jgi:hypothetical protein
MPAVVEGIALDVAGEAGCEATEPVLTELGHPAILASRPLGKAGLARSSAWGPHLGRRGVGMG